MKLSLVVSQGVHAGKAIPVTIPDFVIGRDPQCQLRPASPAISKQHCGIAQRDGKVFVRDCGSTNGTFVNDEQVGGEREVADGDKLRVGPLEFQVRIEVTAPKPVPKKAPATNETLVNEVTVLDAKKLAAIPAAAPTPVPVAATADDDDPDAMAAMMLGMDDAPGAGGGTPTVGNFNPDSTTVMEMPALGSKPGDEPVKKEEKKKVITDSSNAAAELLSKYMRRPRT